MLIPTNQNIKTITDMREDASNLLKAVEDLGLVYVFQHNNPKAVMLSINEFQRLQELIEERLDELEASKLAKRDRGKGVPLEKVIKKYKNKLRV